MKWEKGVQVGKGNKSSNGRVAGSSVLGTTRGSVRLGQRVCGGEARRGCCRWKK